MAEISAVSFVLVKTPPPLLLPVCAESPVRKKRSGSNNGGSDG